GGYYELTNTGNSVTTLSANTGTVNFASSGGFGVSGIATTSDTTLTSNGTVTQSGPITASTINLTGSGSFTLADLTNAVGTLTAGSAAAGLGSLDYEQSGSPILNTNGIYVSGGATTIRADGGIAIGGTGITDSGQTVTLTSNGTVSQTAPITAGGLALLGAGGDYELTNPGNSVTTLAADPGTVNFANSGDLTVGQAGGVSGITTTSGTTLMAGGNITLDSGVTANGIILAASGNFINNYSANALNAGSGNWLVYSTDPRLNSLNGLVPNFIQYNALYPAAAQGSGNGLLYSLAPVVDVSLTGTVSKVYDATTTATLATANYSYSGVIGGDSVNLYLPASGVSNDKNVGTDKQVSVSGISIVSASNNGITVYGYQLASGSISGGVETITPASLTTSGATAANKVYDATTAATISGETLVGVLGSDSVTVSGGGSFADKNVGSRKVVTADLVLGGADAGNYTVTQPTGLFAGITPASLLIAAVPDTKVYDTTTKSSAIPSVSGIKGSDTVSNLSEVFDSPSVGSRILSVNSYTVNDGNSGNNYNVTTTTAMGTITVQATTTGPNIQASQASTQATGNGTGSTTGNPSTATSGEGSTGLASQIVAASNYSQQGVEDQKNGDFGGAVVNFRQATDILLQNGSLPQALEAVALMKTAELQDYFQDAAITGDQTHKTRLKDLPKDTAVVYTLIFPKRMDLILGARSGTKKFSVPIDAATLSQDINRLRASLQRRSRWDYLAEAQRFYNLIISPLELELNVNAINTVIFIPDGALRTVPFAALYDGSRFLIEKYAVVVTPSLNLTDPRSIPRKDTRVFSAGLTESVQGFAPLSNVGDELDGIQGLYRADRLENSTFIEGKVREDLKDNPYSIVHIATHGNFAPKASDTFLLAWDGKIDMNQLDSLMKQSQKPVDLLCLSACETAAGDERAALGLAGVAVKAGARSAFATLWSVSDQASSELVLEFYRQLKNPGVTKAEALQAAQLMLLDDPRYRHPYYWSPFLLIGNWL
ncbi:MAG: CHAT domain-containing protein, partial [Syntrophobacteraceae bacterium]